VQALSTAATARFQTIAALADSGGRSFEHVGAGPARAREDWLVWAGELLQTGR
jgi:hypothetical protein